VPLSRMTCFEDIETLAMDEGDIQGYQDVLRRALELIPSPSTPGALSSHTTSLRNFRSQDTSGPA
jgi:hypothetical protein